MPGELQVLSRSFVSQPSGKVTVLPVIDLCNHRAGAAQPALYVHNPVDNNIAIIVEFSKENLQLLII